MKVSVLACQSCPGIVKEDEGVWMAGGEREVKDGKEKKGKCDKDGKKQKGEKLGRIGKMVKEEGCDIM